MRDDATNDLVTIANALAPQSTLLLAGATSDLETLQQLLQPRNPTLLVVGAIAPDLGVTGRHDLAILLEPQLSLSRGEAGQLLAALRDLWCRHLLVYTPIDGRDALWHHTDLLALGLNELKHYDDGHALFEYNILHYKRTPDWLNARNWANPDMWDRHRW